MPRDGIRTLAELLALPAGRELDAAVAELQGHDVAWGEHGPYLVVGYYDDDECHWVSEDIADAWPLMAEMLAAGVDVSLFWDTRYPKIRKEGLTLRVSFLTSPLRDTSREATVPSLDDAPLAIVRAWLSWKLVEIDLADIGQAMETDAQIGAEDTAGDDDAE